MGLPANQLSLTEFLDWENRQPQRHEFHRGEVFAMVGARRAHGRVVLNLGRRIAEALEGSPCQAFVENMKVQIAEDTVLYPDVFVTCDSADLATEMIFRSPQKRAVMSRCLVGQAAGRPRDSRLLPQGDRTAQHSSRGWRGKG